MKSAAIYGFGSYFKKNPIYRDIDILVTHQDTTLPSCSMAIQCKKELIKKIPLSHITILSNDEEKRLNFIGISQAILLGEVRWGRMLDDLIKIQNKILHLR